MSQKWNLQDIRPAEPRKKRRQLNSESQKNQVNQTVKRPQGESIQIQDGTKKKKNHLVGLVVVLIIAISGVVGISFMMGGAEITFQPRSQQPNLNAAITAYPEQRTGELTYEILSLSASAEREVTAAGEENVQERATGSIEVINTNQQPQQLVVNTRFESPEGRIYRLTEGVTVPRAVQDGDGLIPGTISVSVVAEEVGEEYNIPSTVRFTIPGFAEGGFTQLFESVYAENRNPIQGGFDGVRFAIEDNEQQRARQELQLDLRAQLLERIRNEIPLDFVLYEEAIKFEFVALPPVEYGGDLVTLKEEATLHAPIFQQTILAEYLANASVLGYNGEPVRIDGLHDLSFSYQNPNEIPDNLTEATALPFTLVGRPMIVWTFDIEEFKNQIAGEHKNSLRLVIDAFPAIREAEARIQPFWQQSFPEDLDKITVIEVLE